MARNPEWRRAAFLFALIGSLALGLFARPSLASPAPDPADDGRDAWVLLDAPPQSVVAQQSWIRPLRGQALALNAAAMTDVLRLAPREGPAPVAASRAIIALPRPDGGFERFAFVESPIMEPGLAQVVPDIKTYLGQGLDHPSATVRFDMTPMGFHAQVFTPSADGDTLIAYYIDPMSLADTVHYTSYWRGDLAGQPLRTCTTPNILPQQGGQGMTMRAGAVSRRIIRTAVAATGEYTTAVSPPGNVTVANGLAAIVTAINRVNQVYEIDLAARLVLVANNNLIVYTDASTDPYSGDMPTMQGQNQANLDAVIGNANYDLGHMFDQRVGGGNAGGIGSVCDNGNKGTGFTGAGAPTGDFFWIDYVAHEMGHQLGGTHTFNNCGDNGQRTGSTAYEPGSGISIMGYAGICGPDDLANAAPPVGASIPFFNFSSIDQIRAKVNEGGTCLAAQATGNESPMLPVPASRVLPIRTPFMLTGLAASDTGSGNSHTYSWEQADLGPPRPLGPDTGSGEPLLRPFSPVAGLSRNFPRQVNQSGVSLQLGETLPLIARTSTFTLLVRDNFAGGGGVARQNITVQFVESAGFRVTEPTDGQLQCGSSMTVRWNVAGTSAAPINCANVDIFYSTNGGAGLDYPTNLGTFPNTGSASVTIPNTPTSMGRFMVRGHEQPFFAVSGTFTTDTIPPTIICPADITVGNSPNHCSAPVTFTVTATDNCPITSLVCTPPSGSTFPLGITTVTCTAMDAAGNSASCSFRVTVRDVQPPTVTCPADITVENDPGQCSARVPFIVFATDNCSMLSLGCTPPSGSVFPVGTTTVTCTATDGSGNSTTCTFTVTVRDAEAPVISAADVTVALDEYGNATLTPETFGATATDNCLSSGCPITLSLSQTEFLCPPVNIPIPVTVFATDCHNNTGSRVVNVTFPDPDCNHNGLPDICDILSGRSKDCDHNRVPDECQCLWDGGDVPATLSQVNGQVSHLGGGTGGGEKVADDFYLAPGAVYRIFEFSGLMLTDLIAPLRKARVDLYADCDGAPAGTPLYTFETTTWTELAGPNADGFYLVRYTFDLCDEKLWLDGDRTYWWSLYGVGSCDGQSTDTSSWAASITRMAGSPPVKSDGVPSGYCYPTEFGPWHGIDECCIGCVNMAYKVVGTACPLIWDNGAAAIGQNAGGILSENLSPILQPRGADDFVIKPCRDEKVCLIDAWIWTNCDPVHGFVDLYRNDCKKPGVRLVTLTDPLVINTHETVVIEGVSYNGYILRFSDLDLTLQANQTYWISAAAERTGSQNTRSYFAFDGACDDLCRWQTNPAQALTPPSPTGWNPVGRGLAFRIGAVADMEPLPIVTVNQPSCPADINQSGAVTMQDLFDFLAAYFAGCP